MNNKVDEARKELRQVLDNVTEDDMAGGFARFVAALERLIDAKIKAAELEKIGKSGHDVD